MSKSRANDIDKLVSKKLRMRRVFLGLSQQDLAMAINVSIQQIQKYEKATNRISSGRLYAMANFLKVPIGYFFDESNLNILKIQENLPEKRPNNSEQVSEKEITKLIKAYTEISDDEVRGKFIKLIKSVADDK